MNDLKLTLISKTNKIEDDTLNLEDAFSCTYDIEVRIDDVSDISYKLYSESTEKWLKYKKNGSKFTIYISNNYLNETRYYYLDVENLYTGEITTLVIIQPQCDYRIKLNSGSSYSFSKNDNKFQVEAWLDVYGASKTFYLNKDSFVIEQEITSEINTFEYDNSLYYTIEKESEDEKYNEYKITFTLLGDFENRKIFKYKIPIVHADNSETYTQIELFVSLTTEGYNIIEEHYNNAFKEQYENYDNTIKKRNEKNYNDKMEVITNSITKYNTDIKIEEVVPSFGCIHQDEQNKNIFKIQTAPLSDSYLFIEPKCSWIQFTKNHIIDDTGEYNIVILNCKNNPFNLSRRGLLFITNVENTTTTIKVSVLQGANNGIITYEYKEI